MALAGNSRWCYLDPKLGAMHAVAEAARKVACTGATPVATTNCLNFGNPEKPEIMAQLSAAIDGIGEACTALGTPITGGNVSLYNETRGEGIYPTPVIGIVGIVDDVTKAVPASFQQSGHVVLLIGEGLNANIAPIALKELGSSDFAKVILGRMWGTPPRLDIDGEEQLHRCLIELGDKALIRSASDISSGGVAVALAKACLDNSIGIDAKINPIADAPALAELFREEPSVALVSCLAKDEAMLTDLVFGFSDLSVARVGTTTATDFNLSVFPLVATERDGVTIRCSVEELRQAYEGSLEAALTAQMSNEVHA
jgi:phosphoribosylformylglycinamidine (FGAM) synthase-like enzyme